MKYWVFLLTLFLALILQATLVSLPLVWDVLLLMFLLQEDIAVFLAAFFAGLFLDALLLRPIGVSSLFFIIFLFLVTLYKRKFEIQTVQFAFFSSFLGGFCFLLFFGNTFIIPQALINTLLCGISYRLLFQYKKDTKAA